MNNFFNTVGGADIFLIWHSIAVHDAKFTVHSSPVIEES